MPQAELTVNVKIKDSSKVRKMIRETQKAAGILIKYELLDKRAGMSILERLEDKIRGKIVIEGK